LAKELPEVRQQTNGIRQLTAHAMAARLLTLFFGYHWYQQKIAFRDDPDEWMHNQKGDTGTHRILYGRQVTQLGDCIFTLLKGQFKGGTCERRALSNRLNALVFYIQCRLPEDLAERFLQLGADGDEQAILNFAADEKISEVVEEAVANVYYFANSRCTEDFFTCAETMEAGYAPLSCSIRFSQNIMSRPLSTSSTRKPPRPSKTLMH
jgi:hypothetical protein